MACLEESRMAVERDLLGALQATRRHAVTGDTLALLGDDAAASPLARLVAGH
jgi:hypothetical protein